MGFLRIVIPLAAALLTFGPAALLVGWIDRKKKFSREKRVFFSFLLGLALFVGGGFAYFGNYIRGDADAYEALRSTSDVAVTKLGEDYLFDGPGTERALIFYPGAKIEAEAYAPLMQQLAGSGIDCFLLNMPLHMAFLGRERAGAYLDSYNYNEWYLCGHSLGGAVAAFYAEEHPEQLSGLILLAAYPAKPLDGELPLLLMYGDQDRVMRQDVYEENRENWSCRSTEVILPGANHAQFGNYGKQRGDGAAQIGAKEQQTRTTEEILRFIYGIAQ